MTTANETIQGKIDLLKSRVEVFDGKDLNPEEVLTEIHEAEGLATEIEKAIIGLGHEALARTGVITVGRRIHPGDSCYNFEYEKLPVGDAQGVNLEDGEERWAMEGKFILPIVPLAYPVLLQNVDGDLVRRPFGIKRRK